MNSPTALDKVRHWAAENDYRTAVRRTDMVDHYVGRIVPRHWAEHYGVLEGVGNNYGARVVLTGDCASSMGAWILAHELGHCAQIREGGAYRLQQNYAEQVLLLKEADAWLRACALFRELGLTVPVAGKRLMREALKAYARVSGYGHLVGGPDAWGIVS